MQLCGPTTASLQIKTSVNKKDELQNNPRILPSYGHTRLHGAERLPPSSSCPLCWASLQWASLLFMCEWTVRPGEPTNLELSKSALMHGSACIAVSLKKPTRVPGRAEENPVPPRGMNKRRSSSWWTEHCQWRKQQDWCKKTRVVRNGQACCQRCHCPTASFNDRSSSPIRPWGGGSVSNGEVPNATRN